MSHGIPTVQYGAGDIRIYKEWPTPDERVLLKDLVTAARAVAVRHPSALRVSARRRA